MFIYVYGFQNLDGKSSTIIPLAILSSSITAFKEFVDDITPERKSLIETDTGMYFTTSSFEELKEMIDPDTDWTRDAPVPVEPLPLNMGQ